MEQNEWEMFNEDAINIQSSCFIVCSKTYFVKGHWGDQSIHHWVWFRWSSHVILRMVKWKFGEKMKYGAQSI